MSKILVFLNLSTDILQNNLIFLKFTKLELELLKFKLSSTRNFVCILYKKYNYIETFHFYYFFLLSAYTNFIKCLKIMIDSLLVLFL